jgi:hypothetical protein
MRRKRQKSVGNQQMVSERKSQGMWKLWKVRITNKRFALSFLIGCIPYFTVLSRGCQAPLAAAAEKEGYP